MGIDLINRLCRWRQRIHRRRSRISRTGHYVLLLGHAVQTVCIQNQVLVEAVVEQAKTAAQHGLWRALATSAYAPCKAEARCPVAMIVNRVPRFQTQPTSPRD